MRVESVDEVENHPSEMSEKSTIMPGKYGKGSGLNGESMCMEGL